MVYLVDRWSNTARWLIYPLSVIRSGPHRWRCEQYHALDCCAAARMVGVVLEESWRVMRLEPPPRLKPWGSASSPPAMADTRRCWKNERTHLIAVVAGDDGILDGARPQKQCARKRCMHPGTGRQLKSSATRPSKTTPFDINIRETARIPRRELHRRTLPRFNVISPIAGRDVGSLTRNLTAGRTDHLQCASWRGQTNHRGAGW